MKKILIGLAAAAVIFGAFGVAGFFYARSTFPVLTSRGYGSKVDRGGMMGYQRNDANEVGRGSMMGGRSGMMGNQSNESGEGLLHDKMVAAFSEKLGMSSTELEARLDKGETMYQVAESKGITSDQFFTMMTDIRTQVLNQAVKDGTLTQEQADWMKQHGVGVENGRGRGADNQMDCLFDRDNS
jgi:hypothetical protein